MSKLAKKDADGLANKPADIAQVTVLIDRSGSMGPLKDEARQAIAHVIEEFKTKEGMTLAVRTFNDDMLTIAEFGQPVPSLVPYYPDGNTNLYGSLAEAIRKSKEDAALTPDLKTHHVMVIITDGEDTCDDAGRDLHSSAFDTFDDYYRAMEEARAKGGPKLKQAQVELDSIGVEATFLLLDFSPNGEAGAKLKLKGVKIDHNPAAFRDAMKKVAKAIGQIADNVVRQLPPTTGLCLPPAR